MSEEGWVSAEDALTYMEPDTTAQDVKTRVHQLPRAVQIKAIWPAQNEALATKKSYFVGIWDNLHMLYPADQGNASIESFLADIAYTLFNGPSAKIAPMVVVTDANPDSYHAKKRKRDANFRQKRKNVRTLSEHVTQ